MSKEINVGNKVFITAREGRREPGQESHVPESGASPRCHWTSGSETCKASREQVGSKKRAAARSSQVQVGEGELVHGTLNFRPVEDGSHQEKEPERQYA